jgi:acetyl-CoA carboxylase carboxyltransferase component
VAIPVKPGDEVSVGDRLVVIEAMKNEMAIVAPYGGRIGTVEVTPGVQVNTGAPLLRLEPVHTTDEVPSGQRVSFAEPEDVYLDTRITSHSRRGYDELRCLMLGFDSEPRDLPDLLRRAAMRDEHPAGAGLAQADVLTIFTDICALASRTAPSSSPREEEVHSRREHFLSYLKSLDSPPESWPGSFVDDLKRALFHYSVTSLDHTPELEGALFWISKAHLRISEQIPAVMSILDRRLSVAAHRPLSSNSGFRVVLDRLIDATQTRFPAVADLAREVRYAYYDKPLFESARARIYEEMTDHLAHLAAEPQAFDREQRMQALVDCPQPMQHYLTTEFADTTPEMRTLMFEVMTRRYYRIRSVGDFGYRTVDGYEFGTAKYSHAGRDINVITSFVDLRDLDRALAASAKAADQVPLDEDVMVDVFAWKKSSSDAAETVDAVHAVVDGCDYSRPIRRLMVGVCSADKPPGQGGAEHFTFREHDGHFIEKEVLRGIHPMMARRLQFWRLQNFDLERLGSAEDVYLFHGVARDNERDERLFAMAEVRDLTAIRDESGRLMQLPAFERALIESLDGIRRFQAHRPAKRRVHSNLVTLYCWPVLDIPPAELHKVVQRMAPAIEGLDLDEIVVRGHVATPGDNGVRDVVVRLTIPAGTEIVLRVGAVSDQPVATMTDYHRKVVQMRRRGLTYPYEIVRMLTPDPEGVGSDFPPGSFVEYDFDEDGNFVAVDRAWGENNAGMIVGLITNYTVKHPEGVSRVMILGDPTRALGALAEPECVRVNAALDLAEQRGIPVEWFAVSSGAKISMDSGTENLDWVARTLRRIIEFTQTGGEINIIVDGINVGGQPYWNAEATMLQHTRGILIMTPDGAMVLTGKLSLDFSGSVSAEDNHGIGGYDRIMGPNSQGQYFAVDLAEACKVLLRHYEHTYVAPAERFPRRAATSDPVRRDVRRYPHPKIEGADFTTVGDIFSDEHNPGRKKPFDIRAVMRAVSDQDMQPLERWRSWRHSDTAIVWDAHVGGYPVCLLGIEGRPIQRRGFVPADGPGQFTSGTLFPQSSKKVMRAINSASGNRPVVVLANLTGFDGSPESMRNLQLEYGAEIGRAVVNFEGPMVLCVVSRYHGGAFVVFSAALNEGLEVAAVEGSYASVIGGAPAAGVVFAREVDSRTQADDRIASLQHDIDAAEGAQRASLRARMAELYKVVRSEKLAEVADEFDAVHSVQRAQRMGSVHRIIPAETLRPYLVDAIERGMSREMERIAKT